MPPKARFFPLPPFCRHAYSQSTRQKGKVRMFDAVSERRQAPPGGGPQCLVPAYEFRYRRGVPVAEGDEG